MIEVKCDYDTFKVWGNLSVPRDIYFGLGYEDRIKTFPSKIALQTELRNEAGSMPAPNPDFRFPTKIISRSSDKIYGIGKTVPR